MSKTQDSQEDFLRREKAVIEYFDKILAVLKEKVMISCYKLMGCEAVFWFSSLKKDASRHKL